MSDCRQTADRLTLYVDGELPPPDRAAVEDHLHACPSCRASEQRQRGARTVLRERAARLRAPDLPPGLRTRCAALAHGGAPAAWRRGLIPATVSGALVLVTALVLLVLATQRSNTVLAAQLTADHAKCFRIFPPAGRTLDARATQARLSSVYGWDVHVPPSSPGDGVRLIGARRCLYGNGPVPHLLYDVDGQPLSLFVLEGESRPEGDVTTLGHRSRLWSRGTTTFVLVSPASAGELAAAVAYVRQETR